MNSRFRRNLHKETGSTVVLAVVLSLLMLLMATALIGFAYFTSQQAYFYHDYAQALYAAEAGLNRLVAVTTTVTFVTDTVGSANSHFYAYSYSTTGGFTYAISTGEVMRIRSVHRIVQVKIIPGDSPWNHMIFDGGPYTLNGGDPSTYPPGYNSTTNGPKDNQRYIPRYIIDTACHWIPYYDIATSTGNLFLSKTTTIGSTAGLTISWSGNNCNISGTYNGLIYVEGTIYMNTPLTVNGSLIAVGGNIDDDKTLLTVNQDTMHMDYVALAAIDTTASDDYTSWTPNLDAGNIIQGTGNSLITVNGGAVYCSNIYSKNGQGSDINGVIVGMSAVINGFPSGTYEFDPDVYLHPPLGFDISKFNKRQIASKSWRELPYSM